MEELDVADEQRTVQRLLGCCLLSMQQYERLLKRVIVVHDIEGSAPDLSTVIAGGTAKRAKANLGDLAKEMFQTFVVAKDAGPDDRPNGPLRGDVAALNHVRVLNQIQMSSERREASKAAIRELVDMRNDLVHHLVEIFDIRTIDGCLAARLYLEECQRQIDIHLDQLRQWAQGIDNTRALAASFMQSEAFFDLSESGIAPDGTIDWPRAGVVACFREAATTCDAEGWSRLNEAIAFVEATYPEHAPEKYACRTWPHVLDQSRAFDIAYRPGEGGARTAWYRERPQFIPAPATPERRCAAGS